ncbi:MAG: PilZ domain-containing protein [Magnetococcales bacterium]|nr:PilZ domain-containing protein [Magnetococcales bacterium]
MSDQDSPETPSSNRRFFSRVDFSHDITLQTESGETIPGAFSDISLKGMLFLGDTLPQEGEKVTGTLELGDITINISGEVLASNKERGAAILFKDLDFDSFAHLRQLLSLNLGDSDKIDKEFFTSL